MKSKYPYAQSVTKVQRLLRPFFKEAGYAARGRTYNRLTEDGLTQVINFQVGVPDPPAPPILIPANVHGLFTVNLGVSVPEVLGRHQYRGAESWIQEYHCCIRSTLGRASEEGTDLWWPARDEDVVAEDLRARFVRAGLPFLDRFSSRDKILVEWRDRSANLGPSDPPRVIMAIILSARGEAERAHALLARQLRESPTKGHSQYLRELAVELGLPSLDG